MKTILIHKKITGWEWHLRDFAVLSPWFCDYKKLLPLCAVKSNALRSVSKVKSDAGNIFVKHNSAHDAIGRLKACFNSKAKAEFESALMLEEHDVPVVKYLGWGRRGMHEDMLVSMALETYSSVKDFWFKKALADNKQKILFLHSFAQFLKKFFKSGLYHPDFHVGNILVNPLDMDIRIVDPYGVRTMPVMRKSYLFRMYRIIGAFRGELSSEDAIKLVMKSGMAVNSREAGALWKKIIQAESDEIEKLWAKRKKQILSGRSKYSSCFEVDGQKIVVRNSMDSLPCINASEIGSALKDGRFCRVKFSKKDAEKIWLASFHLQFHRIAHPMPVLREKYSDCEYFSWYQKDIEHYKDNPVSENEKSASQRKSINVIREALNI